MTGVRGFMCKSDLYDRRAVPFGQKHSMRSEGIRTKKSGLWADAPSAIVEGGSAAQRRACGQAGPESRCDQPVCARRLAVRVNRRWQRSVASSPPQWKPVCGSGISSTRRRTHSRVSDERRACRKKRAYARYVSRRVKANVVCIFTVVLLRDRENRERTGGDKKIYEKREEITNNHRERW